MSITVLALPASAAPGDAVEVELKGIQRGAVVEGTMELSARASSPAGIKKIELAIGGRVVETVNPSGVKQQVDLPYSWVTSMKAGSSEPSPNGEYDIVATATANGGAGAVATTRVIVDNPAATPTGLVAGVTGRGVALSWDANPEPDLVGYQVERSVDGDFEILGETAEPSALDAVGPGTYSYRVTAIRSSAARSSGRPSAPSEPILVSIQGAAGSPGDNPPGKGTFTPTRGFKLEEGAIAPRGLPSTAGLPGAVGLPALPAPAPKWGTYEAELPYEIPEGGISLSAQRAGSGRDWTLLPSDGLRWVAAGALLLALASLLRLFAQRLDLIAGPPPLPKPARSLKL
jgi:hypothetical protein